MGSAWNAPVSQGFGPTSETLDGPYQGYAHFNKGTDFAAPAGSSVEARTGGVVVSAGNQGDGWGYSIKIRDADGNTHNYGHMDANFAVGVGQQVVPGQPLGAVGGHTEGESSTGPHLSYDVWDANGQFFDALADGKPAGGMMTANPDIIQAVGRYQTYTAKYNAWLANGGGASGGPAYPFTTEQDVQQQNDEIIAKSYFADVAGGKVSADDILNQYKFWNATDPKAIDAQNAGDRYTRELAVRQEAATISANLLRESNDMQQKAVADRQDYMKVDAGGSLIRRPGGGLVPQMKVPTGEELFASSLATLKAGLPDVPDMPYPSRPPGAPGSLGGTDNTTNALQNAFGTTSFKSQPPAEDPRSTDPIRPTLAPNPPDLGAQVRQAGASLTGSLFPWLRQPAGARPGFSASETPAHPAGTFPTAPVAPAKYSPFQDRMKAWGF